MEAARIPWRPLGRILVEQGLLTSEELETALEQQERTGKRLGETIVECGFVSGPELSSALASQYGIELTTETGFGTGLRGQIQRRHETERRGVRPTLVESLPPDDEFELETEPQPEELEPASPEASLLTQLEEQWARLAAAEALLAEQRHELALLAAQRDRRHEQAARFARRARSRPAETEAEVVSSEHVERLEAELRSRDQEIERLTHEQANAGNRLAASEAALAEREHEAAEHRNEIDRVAAELQARGQELEEARGALGTAQGAIEAQDRRFEELAVEFEHVVRSRSDVESELGAAQALLVEREQAVEKLHHELGRRRDQARRFVERLRSPHQHEAHADELDGLRGELAQAHEALAAAETALGEQHHRLEELRAELERAAEARTRSRQRFQPCARPSRSETAIFTRPAPSSSRPTTLWPPPTRPPRNGSAASPSSTSSSSRPAARLRPRA